MIDKDLIKYKMSDIQGYFRELEPILQNDTRDIIEDSLKLRTIERLFQLIVDIKRMVDDIKKEISDYLEYLKFIDSFLKK